MDPPDGKYAIHAAAREGKTAVVESLLNANPKLALLRDADDRLPLHWAVTSSSLPTVTLLLNTLSSPALSTRSNPFDPDPTDTSGWTPLHIASSLPHSTGEAILSLLLSKSASPTATTTTGLTPLHLACSKDNLPIARLLLASGASSRVKDKRGQLPLHRAAAIGSVPLVKLLLENKSPINGSDVDGMTALHQAVSEGHGDVAVELLRQGAEPGKKDGEGRVALECSPDAKVRRYVMEAAEREGIEL